MFELIILKDVYEYLASMPPNHRAKARAIMDRLEAEGPMLHRPHADAVRGKIRELRCGMHTFEHRFLFFFDRDKIVLTHGFLKKDWAIPEREIAKAERCYDAYFRGGKHE